MVSSRSVVVFVMPVVVFVVVLLPYFNLIQCALYCSTCPSYIFVISMSINVHRGTYLRMP